MIEFDVERVERDLGLVVRELRIKRDYSQRELADRAGVGLTALRSLEKGHGSTLTTLSKIVHALGRDSWLAMLDDATAQPKPLKKKKKKRPDVGQADASGQADAVGEKRRRVAKRAKSAKAEEKAGKAEDKPAKVDKGA
ncbi:helix-turn-helix protein [Microterricola gilva]|uniref:Helix-turn-helix protein n=1 Tax=Microterricola gilva TaxID=393267 RepID=A0A4Q8APU8_9MICO|nr:helix-turn-helix domain-containing protein [Microterricola gilva]RZU66618.1 helix-turn-helix protein [Microterricola gilva]